MKRLLLLIGFALIFSSAYSQNKSIENARWVNFSYQYNDNYTYLISISRDVLFTTTADTNWNAKSYLKLFEYQGALAPKYYGALRVDSLKWYFMPKDSAQELLAYDFGLEINDTLYPPYYLEDNPYSFQQPMVVGLVDTINYLGRSHRRFQFNNGGTVSWLEGVGSPYGLFRTTGYVISGHENALGCFSKGDSVFWVDENPYRPTFQYPDSLDRPCAFNLDLPQIVKPNQQLKIYPNPVQNYLWVEWGTFSGSYTVEVLNLDGRLLSTHQVTQAKAKLDLDLAPGLYVLRCRDGLQFGSTVFSVKH